MATGLPNIGNYFDGRFGHIGDPLLMSNFGILMEDFLARLSTTGCGESHNNENKHVPGVNTATKSEDQEQPSAGNTFSKHLLDIARDFLSEMDADHAPSAPTEDKPNNEHSERNIPIVRKNDLFEAFFDMSNCNPETIQVEIKDRLLKVENSQQTDQGNRVLRYEKLLPEDVSISSLNASLLSNGKLRVTASRTSTPIDSNDSLDVVLKVD